MYIKDDAQEYSHLMCSSLSKSKLILIRMNRTWFAPVIKIYTKLFCVINIYLIFLHRPRCRFASIWLMAVRNQCRSSNIIIKSHRNIFRYWSRDEDEDDGRDIYTLRSRRRMLMEYLIDKIFHSSSSSVPLPSHIHADRYNYAIIFKLSN